MCAVCLFRRTRTSQEKLRYARKVCKFLISSDFETYLGHFSIFYLIKPVEAVYSCYETDDNHHYTTTVYKAVVLWFNSFQSSGRRSSRRMMRAKRAKACASSAPYGISLCAVITPICGSRQCADRR